MRINVSFTQYLTLFILFTVNPIFSAISALFARGSLTDKRP
jgi:hypothetical protein